MREKGDNSSEKKYLWECKREGHRHQPPSLPVRCHCTYSMCVSVSIRYPSTQAVPEACTLQPTGVWRYREVSETAAGSDSA